VDRYTAMSLFVRKVTDASLLKMLNKYSEKILNLTPEIIKFNTMEPDLFDIKSSLMAIENECRKRGIQFTSAFEMTEARVMEMAGGVS
jgi:hypothetical protein